MRLRVDATRPLADEPGSGHNRWHPEIPPLARVQAGEAITLETRDGIDGQLTRENTHEDVLRLSLGLGHPLTGPVFVEGAEPGDLLAVDFLDFETADFGVTAIIPGFGFLHETFDEPYVVKWEIHDGLARSEALPGVAVPADVFPGVVGVAPSLELMAEIRGREEELRGRGGAVAGEEPESAVPREAATGLRTIPPRETGGNLDVRQLVAGSRLLLPVQVPGALFSIGDLHFAQGDGETCGVAIEVAGAATVRLSVVREPAWRPRFPAFETPAQPGRPSFGTTGIPVSSEGRNESLDLTLAARNAVLEMIEYLVATRGFERPAAYVLVSACVDLRLSEVVDVPNPLVSALLPLDIFES